MKVLLTTCRRRDDKIYCVAMFLFSLLASFSFSICNHNLCHAHFIHIDQNEFRASGFPRPPPPPPLPPQHPPTKELTPAELMVDLSNDLTYRILLYHSILNRNNFAFSPTALMSVLVALYEGSAGRSAMEIRNVLQLPNNRDVIRVGYRDIHRRLRTYFFSSDNPLKGLSLNKDNVTITRDYETVLMFYGYDLGMDMVSLTIAPKKTLTPIKRENATMTTTIVDPVTPTTQPEINTTEIETTTISTTSTASTAFITTTTETPTAKKFTFEATTRITDEVDTTDETTTIFAATTKRIETETPEEIPKAAPASDTEFQKETAELISSFIAESNAEPFLRIQKGRVSRLPSGKLQAPPPSPTNTPKVNYLPSSSRQVAASSRLSRPKRHIFRFKEADASLFVTLFNPQFSRHNTFPILSSGSVSAPAHITNEYEIENVEPHFLSTHETKENYNTDVISHVFYLENQQLVHTTFKVYNAVLYYKNFDNLKMNVLELELDTPEYNLMILLPDDHTGLVTAATSLRIGPTLRLMRKQLKPRWVQAIIPDFRLHGTMFLTNDLQNMGICDIFEPNRADFRPMTDDKSIYVKHIEQSINVNIRTHPINQLKRNYGTQTQPIQISVNHPFLFFIIDRDVDVAVMAGRVLNPLNVRIQ